MSSETFTNELIEAIQSGKNKSFREKYRNLDYLLIDDIQFSEVKKFVYHRDFNTFNTLFDNKRISFSPVTARRRISKSWKTVCRPVFPADFLLIFPPDYEICCAILNKRAEKEKSIFPMMWSIILQVISIRVSVNWRALITSLFFFTGQKYSYHF
ncbi:MAG: DnaA ATPase domain-containing protein [Dialister sp.]